MGRILRFSEREGTVGTSQHENRLTPFELRRGTTVSVGGTTVMLIHEPQKVCLFAGMRVEPRATLAPFWGECFFMRIPDDPMK